MKLLKYLFLNKKITIFIIFLVLYISHQIYFILIGGTTWDEPASIFSASKQIYKVYLTLVDFNNPIFDVITPQETYGGLLFIPAYFLTSFDSIINIFSALLSNVNFVNAENKLEIALIVRHIFLNIYVLIILLLCFLKIRELYGDISAILITSFILLIPSFNGHSLFNFADIPLAIHFYLAAIYFLYYLGNFETKSLYIIGLVFGLAMLTRVNAIAFLSFLSLFELIHFYFFKIKFGFGKIIKKILIKNMKIYSIAILVLYVGTPSAWKSPFFWLKEVYIYQFNHPNNVPSVLNGKEIFAYEAPRTYLIEWFLYKIPVLIILLFLSSIIMYFVFSKFKDNNLFRLSLFFVFIVNLAFVIYQPVAYDAIRHYLFLIPFIVIVSVQPLLYLIGKSKKIGYFSVLFMIFYLINTQIGLSAYKYVYMNEFVNETEIAIDCEVYVAQSGCGDWATDYWGYGGKELLYLTKKYDSKILYFCPPQFTYSLFQESERPWELVKGDFVFDDSYPFITDDIFYYKSDMLEFIKNPKFSKIEFLSLNYHRPPLDACGLSSLSPKEYKIDCKVIDGVKVTLRDSRIPINYLSECSVKKINV